MKALLVVKYYLLTVRSEQNVRLLSCAMKRMLPAVLKLLLVLAAVSHGTATLCDITENKALVQCYGALGRSVFIHSLNTGFEIYELEVFFRDKEFFRYREKTKTSGGPCQNRCQLIKNGTLRLDRVMKSDSGRYTIEAHGEEGILKLKRNISLTIQDPVSPPALSQLCLPHGEIRASCTSTGEDPQYSWTLDNSPLDGRVAFLSDENRTVILGRNVSGSITCTASNRVSSEHTTQELLKCPGLGAPVNCTLGNGTEIEVRMNASLNALSLLDNTEIFFRAGGAEMVSAVCTSRPHTRKKTSDSQKTPPTFDAQLLLLLLGACGVFLAFLCATLCIASRYREGPNTEGWSPLLQTNVAYTQIPIVDRDK